MHVSEMLLFIWKMCIGMLYRTLEVAEVALLVERGRGETEGVNNVVDLDGRVLNSLISLLGGSVGTNVCRELGQRLFSYQPPQSTDQDIPKFWLPPSSIMAQSAS